ncbi:STAS domain-containing protein [Nocardioides dongkuii]|uniref:hypothetical protein n=1 Tax=Nocardioides dongkuii TaxID=2760089 RepID=UPI00187810FA|nr:hypothetical protein [Nocardioides dongkuii]
MTEEPFRALHLTDPDRMSLFGSIDELSIDSLRATLAELRTPTAVDLSDVTYLPSMALNVFLRAMADGSEKITLQARPGTIAQRVLHVTGLPHELV